MVCDGLSVFYVETDRFEESVIEERRRTAQDLLNFVGQRIYLTNSVIFKQFFQVCLSITKKLSFYLYYTVSYKKRDTFIFSITQTNIDRFSQLFHYYIQQGIAE